MRLLRNLSALFLLFAFLTVAPQAQTSVKFATVLPEGSIWDKAIRRMGDTWQKDTGGKVSLRMYPGGVAGDEPDILRKIRIGQLHAALISTAGLGDVDPAFRVLELPMFYESDEEILYVLDKMRGTFAKRLEEKGLILLNWGTAGWLRMFSTRPISSYAEFTSMKQFVWGTTSSMADWYQERGLRPVPLAATDIMTGLQTGLIESMPVTPLAALSLQWFRTANHMFDHRFAPLVGGAIMSKRTWAKLSPEEREQVLAAAVVSEQFMFAEVPVKERQAIKEMQRRGLELASTEDPMELGKWNELADFFEDKFVESSIPRDLYDEVVSHLETFRSR